MTFSKFVIVWFLAAACVFALVSWGIVLGRDPDNEPAPAYMYVIFVGAAVVAGAYLLGRYVGPKS